MTSIDIIDYLKQLANKNMGIILCKLEEKSPVTKVIQAIIWVKRQYDELIDLDLLKLNREYKECMLEHFDSENPDILNCQKNGYIFAAWSLYDRTAGKIKNKIRVHLEQRNIFGNPLKYELPPEIYITNISDMVNHRVFFSDFQLETLKDSMYFDESRFPESINLDLLNIRGE